MRMVFSAGKWSRVAAACWSRLVVKGGFGLERESRSLRSRMRQSVPSSSARKDFAAAPSPRRTGSMTRPSETAVKEDLHSAPVQRSVRPALVSWNFIGEEHSGHFSASPAARSRPARSASNSPSASGAFSAPSASPAASPPLVAEGGAGAGSGSSSPSGASRAVTFQYSSGTKALISRSRSTISLTATDCTRPADRPFATFFQRSGLS